MKKFLSCLMALTMLLCTLAAHAAETNWDSEDGEDLGDAVNLQNAWLVYTDGGKCVNAAEGLRVTVYDAESESKVYNTVDITGNKYISAVSDMQFFADSYNSSPELIPKTTWLQSKWIGATYEDVSSSAVAKFNNAVIGRIEYGGYSPQYIPELDELDIISENNAANLEKIRKFVGKKEFLVHLCSIIDGLEYDDFADGKYKLAFEPVAYLSYAGVPWALTATECAVLNKYIVNTQGKGKGVLNYLAPLSHSQLPLSAFLTFKELGVAQFSAAESDYTYSKNGSKVYYKDNCIIRSMGKNSRGCYPREREY